MVKKVYINDGELNFKGVGTLASIDDLEFWVCAGLEPIQGIIKVKEGYYQWIDLTEIDEDDFCGYSKITSELIIHKLDSVDAVG